MASTVGAASILALAMALGLLMLLSADVYIRGAGAGACGLTIGWIGLFVPTETSFAVMMGVGSILWLALVLLARWHKLSVAAICHNPQDSAEGQKARRGRALRNQGACGH